MKTEIQNRVFDIDPQAKAFQKGSFNWISGEITYEKLMGLYPSHLLKPHEQVVRFIQETVKKISNPQH